MEQVRLCPAKLWSNADFSPQIHDGAFILCPAKLWNNADFAPQNYGTSAADFAPQNNRDIVSGANIKT